MMIKTLVSASLVTGITLLSSCSKSEKWSVSGSLPADAAGMTLYLENSLNGLWTPVDSVVVGNDNQFKFEGERPEYPEIYRLTLGGVPLYFPIDSIDNITIDAITKFDDSAVISGSHSADMMYRINSAISSAADGVFTPEIKQAVATIMSENLGGIASYYAVNKIVGNTPLFDAAEKFDNRIIGGVATQFATQRPDDPRNAILEQLAVSNRHLFTTPVITADETPLIELKLRDAAGNLRSLNEEWQKGRVIVLNFTLLGADASPAYNMELNRIYDKYRNRGVEIFQVGCDEDEFKWENAAKSLPWVAVYNSPTTDAANLVAYNITSLPTTFVISRDGNQMERVADLSALDTAIEKIL